MRLALIGFAALVALLVASSAVTIGMLHARVARSSWRQHRAGDGWLFSIAGAGSAAFVLVSLAFGLRLIPLALGSHLDLLWLGLYFAFAAICAVALAMRMQFGETSP